MAKYLNRLAAKLALAKLRESKSWIVTKKLICETDEGSLEFDAGEEINIGGDEEGNLALEGQAAVVVISDPEIAQKVADIVASSEELSDVSFVEKPALDAVMDTDDVDGVVDALADGEGEDVEVAEVEVDDEKKESVENKYAKFAENTIRAAKKLVCESILVDEEASAKINVANIKADRVKKESFANMKEFATRVSALNGSIQPGNKEIALNEAGKVMGYFSEADNYGEIYPEEEFENEAEMTNFDASPVPAMEDMSWEDGEDAMAVESCLGKYEESAKTGADYMTMVESLQNAGLKEEKIGTIVSTFNRDLKECVRVFDSRYGKFVAAFKESKDANNFIEEAKTDKLTKRFFG